MRELVDEERGAIEREHGDREREPRDSAPTRDGEGERAPAEHDAREQVAPISCRARLVRGDQLALEGVERAVGRVLLGGGHAVRSISDYPDAGSARA
jgi:hypothetical protein